MESRLLRTLATSSLRVVAQSCHWIGDGIDEVERLARFTRGRMEFRPRPDDLWIVTYPRSGTTWMQYMLHLLLDRTQAFEHIDDVCPWYERSLAVGYRTADDFEQMDSPRIFKSHLLPRWTPTEGRFVYLRRNPSDVVRSYHALYRDYLGYRGSLQAFARLVFEGRVQYGSWLAHVEAWQQDSKRNVLCVEYATLRRDPRATLRDIAEHMNIPWSDARLTRACEGSTIESMRNLQGKFDHATSLLRERGVHPGSFVRQGSSQAQSGWFAALLEGAQTQPRPRSSLRHFLR